MHDAPAIHDAYRRGDPERLRTLLGDPPDFPNGRGPVGVGEIILEYAMRFIRTLLELGADPNYQDDAGFPSLIAALASGRTTRPRATMSKGSRCCSPMAPIRPPAPGSTTIRVDEWPVEE